MVTKFEPLPKSSPYIEIKIVIPFVLVTKSEDYNFCHQFKFEITQLQNMKISKFVTLFHINTISMFIFNISFLHLIWRICCLSLF